MPLLLARRTEAETISGIRTETLFAALTFAAQKHRDQRRKDAEASPYINHPIAVATVLAVEGQIRDEEILLAAILHDTIEDTETTYDELVRHFGPAVAALVQEVTDDKSLPKEERKKLQVKHAPDSSHKAKKVKIADKICNVRDVCANPPSAWSDERRLEYLEWAERVVAGCRGTDAKLEHVFDQALRAAKSHLASTST